MDDVPLRIPIQAPRGKVCVVCRIRQPYEAFPRQRRKCAACHAEDRRAPARVLHDLFCALCGDPFQARRVDVKYCSNLCGNIVSKARQKQQRPRAPFIPEERTCHWCGGQYRAKRRPQRYCSKRCSGNAMVRASRERSYAFLARAAREGD